MSAPSTITELFDGVELIRPMGDFMWPHPTFKGFPACCGPGSINAFSQKAVPETILGMENGPNCCVHDEMWANGPRTWQYFHYSNAVFLCNMLATNDVKGGNWVMRKLRLPFILGWFVLVSSTAGANHFFSLVTKT